MHVTHEENIFTKYEIFSNSFFTNCKKWHTWQYTLCYHQQLKSLQLRKLARSNHWRLLIAKEVTIVLAIARYIKVVLLRTKHLPVCIKFTAINWVHLLKADIHKQVSIDYNKLYRTSDKVNKFTFADTGQSHLDGKLGVISSYDTMNCCYVDKVCNVNQRKSSSWTE